MRFRCRDIERLDLNTKNGIFELLSRLCGQPVQIGCQRGTGATQKKECGNCQGCMNWRILRQRLQGGTFGLEQFNDILLLVNQRPIDRRFFDFFFRPQNGRIGFDDLKRGVARFQGLAMLCYGNIRFAYRRFYEPRSDQLPEEFKLYEDSERGKLKGLTSRPKGRNLPQAISGSKTWLLGYLARVEADRDIATYYAMAELLGTEVESKFLATLDNEQKRRYSQARRTYARMKDWRSKFGDLRKLRKRVLQLQDEFSRTRSAGWLNTAHYLAIDFMDVYVATSMRQTWEFEDVHTFVRKLFSDRRLRKLRLRYFDPTQSHLDYRIDKGLVEGLMLKRAECTVYMVQETDTFGKDSELASTLAQGKPVIAYVPREQPQAHARKLARRPLKYFKTRLPQLVAEERIERKKLPAVYRFLESAAGFDPDFRLVSDEETHFMRASGLGRQRSAMALIAAQGEAELFDSRARSLQTFHPLAIQVHLETGVANGLLVVRSVRQCAELLYRLMTDSCEFDIISDENEGATLLVERISQCPMRVLTDNATLTNSFWANYLTEA